MSDYNLEMTKLDILHGPFDIETHSKYFINYLEVVILSDGAIEYAVPSHQEKLISIAMEKFNVSRDDILEMCPPNMYFDVVTWLMDITGAVCVWTEFYTCDDGLTEKQMESLLKLKEAGLYKGCI